MEMLVENFTEQLIIIHETHCAFSQDEVFPMKDNEEIDRERAVFQLRLGSCGGVELEEMTFLPLHAVHPCIMCIHG